MKYAEIIKREGRKALITGGSSGIGKAFAEHLAKDGFRLTLVARRLEILSVVKLELEEKYSAIVDIISVDLSKTDWRYKIALTKIEFDIIINSAGDGYPGDFGSKDLEIDKSLIQLNCSTPMELTHQALPYLKAKGGGIIFVSSTMGYIGIPMMANYSATKSYMISFGEALYHEVKEHNVSVEVVTPGATKTPGTEKYDVNYDALPIKWMEPEEVAKEALSNLGKKALVVPGWVNWLAAGMSNCILTRGTLQSMMKMYSSRIITNKEE